MTDTRPSSQWLATVNRLALVARLLGGTVHDVNNLLQIISGNAELLESNAKPDLVPKRARAIRTTTGAASARLADVLAFARDNDDGIGAVDLRATAQRSLALFQHALSKARVDAAIDAEPTPAVARANARAVLQITLNLIMNAEQALTSRAGASLRIRLAARGGQVALTVEDNGRGIAPDCVADLFDAHTWGPVPPAPRPADGSTLGIGLAVSQQLARALGGDIVHAAPPSGGCAMTLSLPRMP